MWKPIQLLSGAAGVMLAASGVALAQQVTVDINKVSEAGIGEKIGTVTISEDKKGTTFKVAVGSVPAGKHGFHVH
jgi:Cu-Zn family superoxide dismutase